MKSRVTWHNFDATFRAYGRGSQFSRPALMVLFDHLEDLEDQIGTQFELDVVGLCCDFAEYDSALDAARACGYQFSPGDSDSAPVEWLQERTTVLTVPHQFNVVIHNF